MVKKDCCRKQWKRRHFTEVFASRKCSRDAWFEEEEKKWYLLLSWLRVRFPCIDTDCRLNQCGLGDISVGLNCECHIPRIDSLWVVLDR